MEVHVTKEDKRMLRRKIYVRRINIGIKKRVRRSKIEFATIKEGLMG